jgi:hypothetical protein
MACFNGPDANVLLAVRMVQSRGELSSQCVRRKLQIPSNTKKIHKKDVVEQRVKNVLNLVIDPPRLLQWTKNNSSSSEAVGEKAFLGGDGAGRGLSLGRS